MGADHSHDCQCSCAVNKRKSNFDIEKFNGKWYNIAHYREEGCTGCEFATFTHSGLTKKDCGAVMNSRSIKYESEKSVERRDVKLHFEDREVPAFTSNYPDADREVKYKIYVMNGDKYTIIGSDCGLYINSRDLCINPKTAYEICTILKKHGADFDKLVGIHANYLRCLANNY